jgi:predicted TIM-barrel fold metal-dependent hydrolase
MDGALAIACLIVRGVFEKFPQLKLVASHLGGGICEMIERMGLQFAGGSLFPGPVSTDADQAPARPLPQDEVYRVDLLLGAGSAMRAGVGRGGGDHFIFGTDAPPLKKAAVDIIKSLKLHPADEAKVFSQNARRLLKIR